MIGAMVAVAVVVEAMGLGWRVKVVVEVSVAGLAHL